MRSRIAQNPAFRDSSRVLSSVWARMGLFAASLPLVRKLYSRSAQLWVNHVAFIWNIAESLHASVTSTTSASSTCRCITSSGSWRWVELTNQAAVNSPQQFADSPALPNAFTKAPLGAPDETPAFVDDLFNDSRLYAELGKASPAMRYEYLRNRDAELGSE